MVDPNPHQKRQLENYHNERRKKKTTLQEKNLLST